MRYLTAAQETLLTDRGSSPTILAVLEQSAPGYSRTHRWTSAARGESPYVLTLSGVTYDADVAAVTAFPLTVVPRGGIAESAKGRIQIVQPSEAGALWTDTNLDDGPLDGATIAFYLLFWTTTATAADLILLTRANVTNVSFDANIIDIDWQASDATQYANWPKEVFKLQDYPFAILETFGKVKPVILGDLTGELFDFSGTGTSGVRRHVIAPDTDAMRQRYFLRDIGTSDDQETIIDLDGIICTFVSPTLSSDYVQIDDNLIYAWVPPHRINSATSATVDDPEYSGTENLDDYAVVGPAEVLHLDFPALPASMGVYGHSGGVEAADATIYVVHTSPDGSGDTAIQPYHNGTTAGGATNIIPTATRTVSAITVGTQITDIEDTAGVAVRITNNDGSYDLHVHRVIIRYYVRNGEVLAAWREQRIARSQRGFIESSSAATDDYMDGGYIDPPGTVARTTPATNPADQLETIYRNKNFGLSLRAATYTDPTVDMTARISPSDTVLPIATGEAASFNRGDAILCDYEVMRVAREPNLLSNSGFETNDFTGWTQFGSNWVVSETTNAKAHSGTYSAHLEIDGVGTGYNLNVASLVSLGETYTLSAWVWVVSGACKPVFVYKYDGGGYIYHHLTPTTTGEWERVTTTFTLESGTTIDNAYVQLSGIGEAYFDDIQIVRGSTALDYQSDAELTVTRGCYWTRPTWHLSGSDLYVIDTNGEVNVGAFRGAAGMMRFTTGAELVTDGTFEEYGFDGSNWTDTDPDDKGGIAAADGSNAHSHRYSVGVTRTATGGTTPSATQTITTVAGTWYRLSFWVLCSTGHQTTVGIDGATCLFWGSGTSTWRYHEYDFQADDTDAVLALYGPRLSTGTVYYDDVSVKALTEWSWDHVVTEESDARDWITEATQNNGGGLRIATDEYGRIGAYALDRYRLPSLRPTWDTSDIIIDDNGPALHAEQTDRDSVYTGVIVRYGYDYVRDRYLGATYVVTELESTGEEIEESYGTFIIISNVANILPDGRWDSDMQIRLTTSGTNYKSCVYSDGFNVCDLAFETNGVVAGDWVLNQWYSNYINGLSVIESIDGEKSLTVTDPQWRQAAADTYNVYVSCFPHLYYSGGMIWMPIIEGGAATGPYAEKELNRATANYIDEYHFKDTQFLTEPTGSIIYRLISDSDDGTGTRDQTRYVRDDRERWSMARVAQYGAANNLTIEAPRIHDRATAVALRNALFDYHQRGYIWRVATDLSKVNYEVGDQVVLSHEIVPNGSMVCEIISQSIDVGRGRIDWMLKEIKQQ